MIDEANLNRLAHVLGEIDGGPLHVLAVRAVGFVDDFAVVEDFDARFRPAAAADEESGPRLRDPSGRERRRAPSSLTVIKCRSKITTVIPSGVDP